MIIATAQGQWVCAPSHGCWLPANEPHSVATSKGFEMHSVYCGDPLTGRLPSRPGLAAVSPLLRELITALLLARTAERVRVLAELFADELELETAAPLFVPDLSRSRIGKIAEALNKDPADPRTLKDWATETAMSVRSLNREFERVAGVSFTVYKRQVRLKVALVKLAEGESLTQTALAVGFGGASNFIRWFRLTTGVPPGRYLRTA